MVNASTDVVGCLAVVCFTLQSPRHSSCSCQTRLHLPNQPATPIESYQDVLVYLHVLWSMGTFAFANAPFAPQLAWENRHRKKTQISWPNLECLLRRSVSGFNTLCHNFAGSLQIPAEKFERKGDQKCHRSALGRTGAHFR